MSDTTLLVTKPDQTINKSPDKVMVECHAGQGDRQVVNQLIIIFDYQQSSLSGPWNVSLSAICSGNPKSCIY